MVDSYTLKAEARKSDGSLSPFHLTVSRPAQAGTGEFTCHVDCPSVFIAEKKIHGANAKQATALALWLVQDQLQYQKCALIGEDGKELKLPIDRDAGVPGEISNGKASE